MVNRVVSNATRGAGKPRSFPLSPNPSPPIRCRSPLGIKFPIREIQQSLSSDRLDREVARLLDKFRTIKKGRKPFNLTAWPFSVVDPAGGGSN